jgi:lipoprotein-releasing system ATP-binding protein
MSEALRLEGIGMVYDEAGRAPVVVLDGASVTLAAGEIVALVAPSGTGKSTLLHIAGLLDTPTAGRVWIGGQPTEGLDERARTLLRRDTVGFVYQFHHLLPEFSALENVALPRRAAGMARRVAEEGARSLLDGVGLGHRVDHRPAELSGGEQQRVAVARALANAPKLLLADEPTGNLDPETSEHVFGMLLDRVRGSGLTALIATHNPELAGRMDRILRLRDGRIVEG